MFGGIRSELPLPADPVEKIFAATDGQISHRDAVEIWVVRNCIRPD